MGQKPKMKVDFKDPYAIWGIALIAVGVGFGGLIGGACGGGAGAYILQLSQKKEMANSTKVMHAVGATVLGVVAYVVIASLVLQAL